MNQVRVTILEAIARRRAISARYNGGTLTLAPHLLYERHGDLFVGAFNLSKAWRSEDERQLGHFKLRGLGDVALSDETFEPLPTYEAVTPRAGDTLVFAI